MWYAVGSVCVFLALTLSGCSKEHLDELKARGEALTQEFRNEVAAEMSEVLPLVTSADLKHCAELVQRPNGGSRYKIISEFRPSVRFSCIEQGRGDGIQFALRGERTVRVLTYSVDVVEIRDPPLKRPLKYTGFCSFVVEKGRIVDRRGSYALMIHRSNTCQRL